MLHFKSYGVFIVGAALNAVGPASAALASLVAVHVNTQFWLHFKINSISELINKVSRLKINLLKYFNGKTIFIPPKSSALAGNSSTKFFL